jgi:carbamoyl-phosphate synthase large subunit
MRSLNKKTMFTILFTAIGRRVELLNTFADSFRNRKIGLKLLGADLNPALAPAARFVDQFFAVPRYNDPDYVKRLIDLCAKEEVDLLIPLYEPEFGLLNAHREDFKTVGAALLLSEREVLDICSDKYQTYQFFSRIPVRTPQTWLAGQVPPGVNLPLLAKPRCGMGSAGIRKVESRTELDALPKGEKLLIQEYIAGTEYTLDVLSDWYGNVIAVVPRQRLEVRGGEVVKSRTVRNQRLIDAGARVAAKLGGAGPLNLQCIVKEDDIYWIEINPRLGGGVPLSYAAGVDYPRLIYRMVQGMPVVPIIGQFEENLMMLRYDQSVFVKTDDLP